jgi:MscS family membrane protein
MLERSHPDKAYRCGKIFKLQKEPKMDYSLTKEEWLEVGLAVVIFLVVAIAGKRAIKWVFQHVIRRLTGLTKTTLDDAILDAIAPPLYWLAVIYAFQLALDRLTFVFEELVVDAGQIYFVLYLLVGFALAWRLTVNIAIWYEREGVSGDNAALSQQLMPFLRRVALIILSVIFIIILLDFFNVEVSGFVATLGIGSLAIALAAQAALSDTISGFVIMIDRPYRIGDRIEIQDINTWGDVEDIGLRSTRIRTRDNRMVIVPNSVISKSLVVNHSYPDTQYRIETHVGVAYGTDIEQARGVIVDAVKTVPGVLVTRPVEALFVEFGDSSLVFRVRWWLESYVDTRRMFDRVHTAIYNALNEARIEIPFPQRVVTHKGLPPQDAIT